MTYAAPWTTERLARQLDMVTTMEEVFIERAIALLHEEGFTAEGAGALSLAMLLRDREWIQKKYKQAGLAA